MPLCSEFHTTRQAAECHGDGALGDDTAPPPPFLIQEELEAW